MQNALFIFGLAGLVVIECLSWLADMPGETASGLRAIMWLCIAGPAALHARAGRAQPPDQRGHVRLGLTVALAVLALLTAGVLSVVLPGCGSRDVVDSGPGAPQFRIRRGPPCVMSMHTSDGARQGRITHPTERCRVVVDGEDLP